jgi:hypothetical protein
MGFVEWWKKSSAEASDAHYELRFDAAEIAEMRRGLLSESAKAKFRERLRFVKKLNTTVLVGCGIPLGLLMIGIASLLGFVFFRALWTRVNPVTICFAAFFVIVMTGMLAGFVKMFLSVRGLKNASAEDLQNSRVAVASGPVEVVVRRTRNNSSTHYRINGVEYEVLGDVLGSEIHAHFFGIGKITGENKRTTEEIYNFYHLPKSRYLLHYERV